MKKHLCSLLARFRILENTDNHLKFNPESFVRNHYENFPVASILIPKHYRKDVALVYWFARTADDIADEGNKSEDQRFYELEKFEKEFLRSHDGNSKILYFNNLAESIKHRHLNTNHFLDLISAFKQDLTKKRYNDYNDLLNYCRRSANPVGRIMLELFGIQDKKAIEYSDNICTALQLTNFYQDTATDFNKGRIYYPIDEMIRFSVTEKMFELKQNNSNIKALIKHNVDRTQLLFDEGKGLLKYLSGRFKFEIKLTILGGEKILNMIINNNYNVFLYRPVLKKSEFIRLFIKAIFNV